MGLSNLFSASEQTQRIRRLLREHPNPHVRIVGEGTVRLDPEVIRQSDQYRAFIEKMRQRGYV